MALPVKLDHCVVHVSDWERSNAFYRDVTGAELVKRPVGWAYRFGDTQLNLHGPGVDAVPVARVPVAPGNSDLCFEWRGPIADAVAHLAHCGVAVELGPVTRNGARGQGTSVYFRDPDGSLLEFISYIGTAAKRLDAATSGSAVGEPRHGDERPSSQWLAAPSGFHLGTAARNGRRPLRHLPRSARTAANTARNISGVSTPVFVL